MRDLHEELEKLRLDAEDCRLISRLATDITKRHAFGQLADTIAAMRLYDTLSRAVVELPPPPGPIRMYVCGSTVYERVHVGNSRPFVLGMWLRAWLRQRGYDATLVHNITDINDKIYDAAPGRSA